MNVDKLKMVLRNRGRDMKSLWEVVERDVRRRELEDRKRVLHRVRASLNFHEFVSNPQPLGFTGVAGKPVTPPPP